ncbi:alpha/beta-hydrolase [Tothia fuscella]|uniref:Alpha/beta-hydrolase n=1 Tax=Tothia fuscella TaxID=1048955 RepID=A0A9P4TZJ0_9PEZI|nr:alpha/beta-hydrolase [Tothia fuscella]
MSQTHSIHIVAPTKPHPHTIILLHGRDSTAQEFSSELFESQASDDRTLPEIFPSVKWGFPTSKLRMSQRFQTGLSQWFDIWSLEDPQEKLELQVEELKESVEFIKSVVKEEVKIVGVENVILGGTSQGCATAIHALFHGNMKLGGFIDSAKNSLQLDEQILAPFKNTTARNPASATPMFLGHCIDDEVISIKHGRALEQALKGLGMEVQWREYEDDGHWLNEPEGVDDMAVFLEKIIG